MNEDVVKEARKWLGVRWVHQGRSREGVDCAGLVIKVAQAIGYTSFDVVNYPRQASDESMLVYCREFLDPVDMGSLAPGDILVMAFANQRHIGLVGDYFAGGLSLIHAYALAPHRVVEVRLDPGWKSKVIGSFRLRRND